MILGTSTTLGSLKNCFKYERSLEEEGLSGVPRLQSNTPDLGDNPLWS